MVWHLFSINIFHWSFFSGSKSPFIWSSQAPDFIPIPIWYFNWFCAVMDSSFSLGMSFSWGSSCLNCISSVIFGLHSALPSRRAVLPSVSRTQTISARQLSFWKDPASCDWVGILRSYQDLKKNQTNGLCIHFKISQYWVFFLLPLAYKKGDSTLQYQRQNLWYLHCHFSPSQW